MKLRKFCFLCGTIFLISFWVGLWSAKTERFAHYTPDYERVDIAPLLQKDQLESEDYEILFRQTGMCEIGVDKLYAKGEQSKLLDLQSRYFEIVETVCLRDFLIIQSERLVDVPKGDLETFLPQVENGDILISFNGHVFGWRNGHAAIVVDAEKGLTLEAMALGTDSRVCNIEKWAEYPGFVLLRLKGITQEEQSKVARYAMENLVGIPYRLLVSNQYGIYGDVVGTHCAHLVWLAYAQFGYNLDQDGGMVVTPRDLFECELLEVVQLYGLPTTFLEEKEE